MTFDGNPLRSNCPENDGSREPLEKSKKRFSFVVLILFFGSLLIDNEMFCSNIYGVRGFHVYKSVFLEWVVGRFNIAVNGEHNCGVPPYRGSSSSLSFLKLTWMEYNKLYAFYSFNGICGVLYNHLNYESHATDEIMRFF